MKVLPTISAGFKVSECMDSKKSHPNNSYAQTVLNRPILNKAPELGTLQAYYLKTQPSFGRAGIEHLQHGAYVDKAKNVFFSFATYSDVERVFVELKRKGSSKIKEYELAWDINNPRIFKSKTPLTPKQAKAGDQYAFKIVRKDGSEHLCADPYAKRKTDFLSPYSEFYDHNEFVWSDKNWQAGKVTSRISRTADTDGLTKFRNARILEINIPTFANEESFEGTFEGAIRKINELIESDFFCQDGKNSYNAIEIMPVETTYAPGWSYDGVYKGAPLEALGGPDGLKKLVNYAHSKGINMIMDAVPNHFGIDGNHLMEAGPYLAGKNRFGYKPHLENDPDKTNNIIARDLIANTCGLNWIRDYHFDGVRLDFTQDMESDLSLKQLIAEVNFHHPKAFVILEDSRVNERDRLLKRNPPSDTGEGLSEREHAIIMEKYDDNHISLDSIGADARWSYEVEHAINAACTNDASVGSLAKALREAHLQEILYSIRQSHDETGNNDGIRALAALINRELKIVDRVEGSDDTIRGQNAAQATEEMLTRLVEDRYNPNAQEEIKAKYNLRTGIPSEDLKNALTYAISQNKLAVGLIDLISNAKMRFQGRLSEVAPGRFFRKESSNPEIDWENIKREKGYKPDDASRELSRIDSIPYSNWYRKIVDKTDQFERDINDLALSDESLHSGHIFRTVEHNDSRVLGLHLKAEKSEAETFVVSNFSQFSYEKDTYGMEFPQGKWKQVMNSNDLKYAGTGKGQNTEIISDGGYTQILLPANSLLVFKKVA